MARRSIARARAVERQSFYHQFGNVVGMSCHFAHALIAFGRALEERFVWTVLFDQLTGALIDDAQEFRGDETRLDDHDLDTERRKLAAQAVGNGFQGVFRGVVDGRQRAGDTSGDRANVDDAPARLPSENGNDELRERDEREE